ncbi:hypothetical protein BDZ89DRAFT_338144 [Hymenopellis radicata]|nr:hypothetical protein BDZ89DRAFT_338144 [Hymenopellis radicata]
MTQPGIPLEIKTLIIRELSPYASRSNPRSTPVSGDENAAYIRDLCAVCLAWPDTIAIIRKILFEDISIRPNNHHIDASLRNLCQALENDPGLSTFVKTLEFSHRNTNSSSRKKSPFIPTASRSLFLSFLSFIPNMRKLRFLTLDNMCFHDETSIEFNDLRVLKESSVTFLTLRNSTFSIPAFNVFLGYWEGRELDLSVDGISLIPHTTYTSDQMLLEIDEDTGDWDEENIRTEWEIDKPRAASFLSVTYLELKLSNSGMLMLMDFLASDEWSPLKSVHGLEIFSEDAITATTVIRINNLIRRYEPVSYLGLNFFSNEFEDAIGTPLYLAGIEHGGVRLRLHNCFTLFELDKDLFEWYIESFAAVPPNSSLREFCLELAVLVPLEARDLGSQGVWRRLDSALSGDNLQLETLIIDVYLKPSPNGARTPGLPQLQTWLMEICFPEVTAKYFRCNKESEETEGREMSALRFWIGDEQVDPRKH